MTVKFLSGRALLALTLGLGMAGPFQGAEEPQVIMNFAVPSPPAPPGLAPPLATEKIRVLILDGQGSNDWPRVTETLRGILVQTGRFEVSVSTSPPAFALPDPRGGPPENTTPPPGLEQIQRYEAKRLAYVASQREQWKAWKPDFSACQVVINHYAGEMWPEEVRKGAARFVEQGGGLVNIHGALRAFPGWAEYNAMLGLGWRDVSFGNHLTVDPTTGTLSLTPPNKGEKAGKTMVHDFAVRVHYPNDHPVTLGLPPLWQHAQDEIYHHLRGPAENLQVLCSALADKKVNGSGAYEPVAWHVAYGRGRVINSVLGGTIPEQNQPDSLRCLGFQVLLARSAEFCATGRVTLPLPKTMPSVMQSLVMAPEAVQWSP